MPFTAPSPNEGASTYEARASFTAAATQPVPVTFKILASTGDTRYDIEDCDAAFQAVLDLLDGSPDFTIEAESATKSYFTYQRATPTSPE